MCSGFVSKWNSQAFCLDCRQGDGSKAVAKYSRFLYLCSTKNSKWNLFKKCWKVQKCQFKKEMMGKKGNEIGWKISHLRTACMVWWGIKRQQSHRNHTQGWNKRKTFMSFVQCSCPAMLLLSSSTGGILESRPCYHQQLYHVAISSNPAAFRLGMCLVPRLY